MFTASRKTWVQKAQNQKAAAAAAIKMPVAKSIEQPIIQNSKRGDTGLETFRNVHNVAGYWRFVLSNDNPGAREQQLPVLFRRIFVPGFEQQVFYESRNFRFATQQSFLWKKTKDAYKTIAFIKSHAKIRSKGFQLKILTIDDAWIIHAFGLLQILETSLGLCCCCRRSELEAKDHVG